MQVSQEAGQEKWFTKLKNLNETIPIVIKF